MARNEVGQYPAMYSELVYRVPCPSGRVVNSPGLAFEMGFNVVTGHRFDTPLKFRAILPQVVPQPCKKSPIRASKRFGKSFSTPGNLTQMFLQLVNLKRTIIILTNMS